MKKIGVWGKERLNKSIGLLSLNPLSEKDLPGLRRSKKVGFLEAAAKSRPKCAEHRG